MFDMVNYPGINRVDQEKVNELVISILTEGWKGAPILYHNSIGLITGSHRMAALNKIEEMYFDDQLTDAQMDMADKVDNEEDYALDVTEIIDDYLDGNSEAGLEYDNLGVIFEGTEVEQWKDQIEEW